MSEMAQDPLWPHFLPLWSDLRAIAPKLLLAGGYGLFLKQCWLEQQLKASAAHHGHAIAGHREAELPAPEVQTLVPLSRWRNQTPRVTKDFDLIAGLDVIASAEDQGQLDAVLKKHEFKVVPQNARWQFEKKVEAGQTILLDFHAPAASGKRDDLRFESRRVKPNPSLLQKGIHGRENEEAIGSALYPFSFTYRETQIVLPHPLTLLCMKLVATRDRRLVSQDPAKSIDERQSGEDQARKHANDVCRVMGMMTREESDLTGKVLEAVRPAPAFAVAGKAFAHFFQNSDGWGTKAVMSSWEPEDLYLMQNTIASWFRQSP